MHAELADGSQRRPGEPAVAPAADYEQFGLFGRIHQHLPGSPFYHARTDLDIWADGAHLGDRLAKVGARGVLVIGHIPGRDQAGAGRGMPRRHRLHHQPGQFRLVDGPAQRGRGRL